MCEIELEVIDFDLVKRDYLNAIGLSEEKSKSVDALLLQTGNSIFIEFKNGVIRKRKREVKDKLQDSLLIFCDIIGENISYTREHLDFILIFNAEKNPDPQASDSKSLEDIAEYLHEKANEEMIRFGLEKYKNLYFKNIHTYDKERFNNYMLANIC